MEKLVSYDNGNVHIDLYNDGTLIRTFDETKPIIVDHPSSMDVKITNYCEPTENNPICAYCHEKSNTKGAHGDINKLLDVISALPAGVELALGGGNPLSHPDLLYLLKTLKTCGYISNITINQKHINKYQDLIYKIITEELVHGIGISYSSVDYLADIKPLLKISDNVVFHVIMGVNTVEDIETLYKFCQENNKECKVLVLGYKHYGMGINYYLKDKTVEDNKDQWYIRLASYFKKNRLTLSFDNLAIEQLKLKRYFTEDAWNTFYMGSDGVWTMYIDAVNQEYAKSSTSKERVSFNDVSLLHFFKRLKT